MLATRDLVTVKCQMTAAEAKKSTVPSQAGREGGDWASRAVGCRMGAGCAGDTGARWKRAGGQPGRRHRGPRAGASLSKATELHPWVCAGTRPSPAPAGTTHPVRVLAFEMSRASPAPRAASIVLVGWDLARAASRPAGGQF